MRLDFFTIAAQPHPQGVEELNAHLSQARVLSVDRQFVSDGSNSFWSICVISQASGPKAASPKSSKRSSIDYREILSVGDFAVYARLRELRRQTADQEGVPIYAVFTNEQLAAMAQQRITSLTALRHIDGVGEARVAKYGKAFLELIQATPPATGPDGDEV